MSKKVSGWPLIVPRELPKGLPAYTVADADKMLIVGADETDVVPQQTVTASELGGADLEGLVEELFVPGAAVKVTMDGFTYPIVTVTEETVTTPQGNVTYYEALFSEANTYAIQYYPDDEAAGLTITSGTHTIEAVVMDVTGPAWVNQPVEPEYVIPEITEQDMGKVLTAGEGEPVWAAAGGGYIDLYIGQYPYTNHNITHADFYNAVTEAIHTGKNIRLIPASADTQEQYINGARIGSFLHNNGYPSVFGISITKDSFSGTVINWIQANAQTSSPATKQTFEYFSLTLEQPNS